MPHWYIGVVWIGLPILTGSGMVLLDTCLATGIIKRLPVWRSRSNDGFILLSLGKALEQHENRTTSTARMAVL